MTNQVSAIDKDDGQNGEIYYQLVRGNGELFRVGRKSGQITLRQQLATYSSVYRLLVAAYDGGTPPYSAEVPVRIRVIDESVPLFKELIYKTSIEENVEMYSPILSVEAEAPTEGRSESAFVEEKGTCLDSTLCFQTESSFTLWSPATKRAISH